MRTPSVETQLRQAKADVARHVRSLAQAQDEEFRQRNRAAVLQKERDEWKARFDALLARVPLRAMEE